MDVILWLNISLVIIVFLILVLAAVYFIIIYRGKRKEEEGKKEKIEVQQDTFNGIPKESIRKFMEFDEVKDNMIIRKNGEQYVMVIQCKGINYDLLSEDEKLSVESGFVQFLNTLRFPIQLYVQTRSLNLKAIIEGYNDKVEEIADEIRKLEARKKKAETSREIDKINFEIRRKQNVLEYGMDISEYIGRMNANQNVLQQKNYVILSYFSAELGPTNNYSKDEIRSMCFSELYTRAQTVINALASAQVYGRTLDSEELAEMLYIAYNRDDSELYQLSKALDAEYDALYATAKDVLDKKKEKIEAEIEEQAIDFATDSIIAADKKIKASKKEIKQKALEVVEEYKDAMDPELYEETKKQIIGEDEKSGKRAAGKR